ncbi:MAG: hypothetical protein IKJ72_01015, partial [Mycoplasmataceae bacterium]|nr:hypothetical protein [Mycoplasmataceae bacterium]
MQEQELKQIHAEENLYNDNDLEQKYGVWKTLETSNWQKELGLLVNDYVVVTIRVKKDKLTTEDESGYAINYDQDYIPFQQRVYGYKIKTKDIKINLDNLVLENVGQAESASYALDGYARLKHLSLEEDQDKNYLGASVKINYFNDFYKDDKDQILVSGSGQVLVKREEGSSIKEYKDQEGKPIKDKDQNQIFLNLKSNGTPTNPTKENSSKNSINLQEYSKNSFRFDDIDSKELKYNFFQNQQIEFEISNKKGEANEEEYDYYLDDSSSSKKIEYTFTNIKFPINNDSNISYEFNSQEFIEKISDPNNLKNVYQNSLDSNKEPINGQSKLVEMFSITRKENNKPDQELKTLLDINNKIKEDFAGQVKLVATYTSVDGRIVEIDNGDISTIGTLKNGDRFKIEIVSNSSDLIFAQHPNPLIFAVQGLYEQPIDQGLLKYLRVKQSGIIDGQGSFNILVDD